jgi:hypothetical protein
MALTTIKPSGLSLGTGQVSSANIANLSISTVNTTNLSITGSFYQSNLPLVLNEISNYFDGRRVVFPLNIDQNSINTITDSKDLEVVVNGSQLKPYVKERRYPWIVEYDSYSGQGYRVSGANLIIYNAPGIGDQCTLTLRSTSGTTQIRKYPFSASTIALGD